MLLGATPEQRKEIREALEKWFTYLKSQNKNLA